MEKRIAAVWKEYFNGWDEELDKLSRENWALYRKCPKNKRGKPTTEWKAYQTKRNQKRNLQKIKRTQARKKRGKEKREMMKKKDKNLYKLLHEYNNTNNGDTIKALMDRHGNIQTSDEGIKNAMLDQGRKLFQTKAKSKPDTNFTPKIMKKHPEISLKNKFTLEEVHHAIDRANTGKAAGPEDDISAEVYKSLKTYLSHSILEIYNCVLKTEEIPQKWRNGTITNFFKNKGSRLDPGNYRGITLLCSHKQA